MPGQQPNRSRFAAHRSQRHSTAALPIERSVRPSPARNSGCLRGRIPTAIGWESSKGTRSCSRNNPAAGMAGEQWARSCMGQRTHPACGQATGGSTTARRGWSLFPGGPLEISASVKAYLALRSPAMHRRSLDDPGSPGHPRCRWCRTDQQLHPLLPGTAGNPRLPAMPSCPARTGAAPPVLPAEHLRDVGMVTDDLCPLSLLWAHRPHQHSFRMENRKLFLDGPSSLPTTMPQSEQLDELTSPSRINWNRIFTRLDAAWKGLERWKLTPFRGMAIRRAADWMIERFADSDGLGAIFPPMVWSVWH
ncbi:MAG: hypothetical protein CM1200mP2_21110 [Planctomycetaceae bacterium]|nr:MAG: hypothetical protein CM1200mP2_21110 [Planctomycetaceae bacterium]